MTNRFLVLTVSCGSVVALFACSSDEPSTTRVCGNDLVELDEVCDGADLADETCQSLGFVGGTLACRPDCLGFDTRDCHGVAAQCGNDEVEAEEICDGTDLAGETCVSRGFVGGTLSCLADCSGFDTSACEGTAHQCGNNVVETGEVCDGTDLAGETCVSRGFDSGTLGCRPDCSGFDFTGCSLDPTIAWILISGGTYQMGSTGSPGYSYTYEREQPIHEVTVVTFEMTRTEITVAQYADCVTAGACDEPSTYSEQCNWNEPGYDAHPVNCTNWFNAVDFCEWAGGRLPSEAEWEYAARSGGQDILYPWGDEVADCEYAVMWEGDSPVTERTGCGTTRTMPVCSRPEGNTVHGLCDMAGNVWEWVQDRFQENYEGVPTDGSAWELHDGQSRQRVSRGGSYNNPAHRLRASYRHPYDETYGIDAPQGFRCARR